MLLGSAAKRPCKETTFSETLRKASLKRLREEKKQTSFDGHGVYKHYFFLKVNNGDTPHKI